MVFQYSPFILPLIFAAILSGWLAYYTWKRRNTQDGIFLSVLAIAINEWLWGYALEIAGADLSTKLIFGKISYLGITTAPLMWFVFAYLHANKENKLSIRSRILLSIIPFITVILALTNDWHGLIWSQVGVFREGSFSALEVTHGIWFWIHTLYSYILLLAGTVYIIRSLIKIGGKFRLQSIALLVAVLSPWVGNLIYLLHLSPFPYFDLTPFAFTITLISLTWAVLGFQLINLAPIARDYIVEHINDGMIVSDGRDCVIDINPSALKILNRAKKDIIGRRIEDIFAMFPDYVEKYKNSIENLGEIKIGDEFPRWYELHLSLLKDKRNRKTSSIISIHDITGRKQTEIRLSQLSRAVEASPVSIVITDTKGLIQYVNPKFTQITGYTAEEVFDRSPGLLKTEFTPHQTHKELWQTIQAGSEWHGEFCNRKKNGEIYWESASISPISTTTGIVTHYVAVKEDITGQRLLQEKLRQHNNNLSQLYQVTLDLFNRHNLSDLHQAIVERAAILLHSPYVEIMIKEENDLVVRSTTKNQIQVIGKKVKRGEAIFSWQAHDTGEPVILKDYSTWEGQRSIYKALGLCITAEFPVMAGKECIAILALGRTDSKEFFTEEEIQTGKLYSQLVALILENANLYHSALNEITDRKHSQSLLQESESRYRQIIDNASDLIYRVDAQGLFTYVNPPTLHMFGYPNEQGLLGRSFMDLAAPDTRPALKAFYDSQVALKQITSYYEFLANLADNRTLWLGQNVQLICEAERVVGLQAVARDITERKRAEESLALARDQALEASQFKSQLLAKVSHELRTPLGAILGYTELMQLGAFGSLADQQVDVTRQIVESVQYLNNVINDLLDEAQISAQKFVIHMNHFSLYEMLKQVDSSMIVLAAQKNLQFSLVIAPNLPEFITGDENRIRQILINLSGNAIKYTHSGNVKVDVYCQDHIHWGIKVSDTGEGIPEDALESIFEPFRQVNNALKNNNRGTGLGLTITKQLVELMGGVITVHSKIDQGSTFTVVLPLIENMEKAHGKTTYLNR